METLSSLFQRSCHLYRSKNVAVTFAPRDEKSEHITYQEISTRSSEVAAFLRTLCEGAQAIAVYSKQFTGLIVCLLGVLEAGCHFAPIDITWPPLMACRFLSQLNVGYVLVDGQLFGSFQKVLSCWKTLLSTESRFEIIRDGTLDANRFLLVQRSNDSQVNAESMGLAYVMQTSGTTGEPKAVKVPHNCIVPNITDLREIFQVTVDDVVFVASPYTFDPFIVQVFIALTAGARLVLVPDDTKIVPSQLCHCLFDRERVTIFQPTPSLMHYIGTDLIRSKVLCAESSVRILALGGESCPSLSTLRQWRPAGSNTQVFNLYGITEVSCWASCYRIPEDKFVVEKAETEASESNGQIAFAENFPVADMKNEVPLGTPLLDTIIELRDEDGRVVEQGMGQIYIGGSKRACLLGNELSLSPGTLRATGDWAYVKDRMMWYCGRRDRQVKRMGKMINLDWIEHQISEKILGSTCCLVLEQTDPNNLRYRLHLFVVQAFGSHDKENLDFLESSMRDLLPVYAQPDCIHVVSHLPMTAHGKVNRQALLADVKGATKPGTSGSVRNSVRNFLKRAWSNALEVNGDNMANDANVSDKALFILCGGTSFAAVRLAESIESWIIKKTNAVVVLSESLEVILNKPFGSLCSYVESKVKLIAERDVADKSTIDHQRKDSTVEEIKRTGIVSSDLEEVSHTAAAFCQQQNMHEPRSHHVKLEGDKNNVSTVIQGKASLENNEQNYRTSPVKQVAELSVKRKRLFFNSHQPEGFPVRPKKIKMQLSMSKTELCSVSEDDLSICTKLVSGFQNCYCSVRRGMQWRICKFCKMSKADTKTCAQSSFVAYKAGQSTSKGVRSRTVASLQPNSQLINHISNKQKAALTSGGNILRTNHESTENLETCNLNLQRNVFIDHKWRTSLYKCIDASPLVVFSPQRTDGEVFIGSHGHVFMCVRLSDGEVLWETRVEDRIESSAVLSNEGTNVIVGCYDGKVYVFDRETGSVVWTFQTGAAVKSSPCVDPQTSLAWMGSHDHHLYALDVTNKQCVCALDCGDGSCFSSPSVSRQPHLVFIATLTGRLLAVHATKYTVLWSQQCPKPAFASPLVLPVGVVCACVDGSVYSFDFQGKRLWQFQTEGSIFCSPSYKSVENSGIACGRVVLGSHDRCVYCLSLGGELKWSFTTDGQVYATPFITELNASPSRSSDASSCHERDTSGDVPMAVYTFSTTGTLYMLDFNSGRLLGSYSLPGEVFSSPVVVDNRVLIGCRDDFLYSLEVSISSQRSTPVPRGEMGCRRTETPRPQRSNAEN